MQRTATFFIATARSGTQWLAANLQEIYGDLLVAEHEPIGYAYRPRRYLRSPDKIDELRSEPAVAAHFESIRRTLGSRSYVEVGFPAFALLPLLEKEFEGRVQIVHLIRNPVDVAASLVTHRWYDDSRQDSLGADIAVTPLDAGVAQQEYAARWDSLSSYEKCLFYWTEVHTYGLEVQATHPHIPFLSLYFERMFATPTELQRLTDFLSLPYREGLGRSVSRRVDSQHRKTSKVIRWEQVFDHERTVELATRFGYDLSDYETGRIEKRYLHSEAMEWIRSTSRLAKRGVRKTLGAKRS